MVRVVIDTCVLVTAGMSKRASNAHAVIQKGLLGEVELYASPETIAELKDVFSRPKFTGLLDTVEAQNLLKNYLQKVKIVAIEKEFLDKVGDTCKDPKDIPFLALADQNQCEFITSVDKKHLLSLVSYQGVKILRPVELVEELEHLPTEQKPNTITTQASEDTEPPSHDLFQD